MRTRCISKYSASHSHIRRSTVPNTKHKTPINNIIIVDRANTVLNFHDCAACCSHNNNTTGRIGIMHSTTVATATYPLFKSTQKSWALSFERNKCARKWNSFSIIDWWQCLNQTHDTENHKSNEELGGRTSPATTTETNSQVAPLADRNGEDVRNWRAGQDEKPIDHGSILWLHAISLLFLRFCFEVVPEFFLPMCSIVERLYWWKHIRLSFALAA